MITAVVSIVTFVAGLLIGHWLALDRDKRKEFNEASLPVREWLLKQKSEPRFHHENPDQLKFDTFVSCLSRRSRKRFEELWASLSVTLEDTSVNSAACLELNDPATAEELVGKLLPLTARR